MASIPATPPHHLVPPNTPHLIAPADGAPVDGSAPTFTWHAVSGALDYRLHVAADADFQEVIYVLETGPTTLLTLLDMLPRDGSVFHWRVQALTPSGWQAWSPPEHFKALTDQHEVAFRTQKETAVKKRALPNAATQTEPARQPSTGVATYQRGYTSKATMALFLAIMLVTFAATFASLAYIVFSAR